MIQEMLGFECDGKGASLFRYRTAGATAHVPPPIPSEAIGAFFAQLAPAISPSPIWQSGSAGWSGAGWVCTHGKAPACSAHANSGQRYQAAIMANATASYQWPADIADEAAARVERGRSTETINRKGPMPYFNFDLVIGEGFKNQGGMILEDTEIAIDKANSLASSFASSFYRTRSTISRVAETSRRA